MSIRSPSGMNPAMTLVSVVFPAPVPPEIRRLSPGELPPRAVALFGGEHFAFDQVLHCEVPRGELPYRHHGLGIDHGWNQRGHSASIREAKVKNGRVGIKFLPEAIGDHLLDSSIVRHLRIEHSIAI